MTTLVIPAAGQSSRYGLSRPKYLLQHPSGVTMLTAGLRGLTESLEIEKIHVVCLKDHLTDVDLSAFGREIYSVAPVEVHFQVLQNPTSSMVETVLAALSEIESDVSFVVKDVDNLVEVPPGTSVAGNFVVGYDITEDPDVQVGNKSFLLTNDDGYLTQIIEKKIVSGVINTGVIGFESSSEFILASSELTGARELFLSSIVSSLLSREFSFSVVEATKYLDWGTLREWQNFTSKWATYFVDLDGVLVKNANALSMTNNWEHFDVIRPNLDALLELQSANRAKFVFTTSRSKKHQILISEFLKSVGFLDFSLVTGLPHSKRILINDFAATNPYPSAVAINLERNSEALKRFL